MFDELVSGQKRDCSIVIMGRDLLGPLLFSVDETFCNGESSKLGDRKWI